ncbi:major facilitator superfamily domain-containing protein 6-like [Saccoglossus kowalevskii]
MVVMGFDYTHVMPIKSLHSLKAVAAFLMSFYYMSILLTSFFMGACNGVIVSFLYMYLEDLGAVPLLLGIASFISLSSNVLMYIFVHDVIEVIGHIWVIMCGLGGYTVRFIIYSQIYNPWFVLPGECLQGISSAAISIALTSYFAADVPTVSMTTIQGILYMMHMGLGTFAGNLIGGALYDLYGARTMFLLFGITSCTVLVIFFFALRVTEKPKFPEPDCKTYLELEGINTNKKNVGKETKEDN